MLKNTLLALLLTLAVLPSYGQKKKKKDLQFHKIKTITVVDEDYESSKGKQTKDTYNKYDENGNMIEEILYNSEGKEKSHIVFEYDDDGNKIKETYLKANGTKEKVIEYKYNDGLRTEKIVYLPNGKVKSKKKYTYVFHE